MTENILRRFNRWYNASSRSVIPYRPTYKMTLGNRLYFSIGEYDFGLIVQNDTLEFFCNWYGDAPTQEYAYFKREVDSYLSGEEEIEDIMNAVVRVYSAMKDNIDYDTSLEEDRLVKLSSRGVNAMKRDIARMRPSSRIKTILDDTVRILVENPNARTYDNNSIVIKYRMKRNTFEILIRTYSVDKVAFAMLSPRFDFMDDVPIRMSGLILIDGLTPSTFSRDFENILEKFLESLPTAEYGKYHTKILDQDVLSFTKETGKKYGVFTGETEGNGVSLTQDLFERAFSGDEMHFVEIISPLGFKTYCPIADSISQHKDKIGISVHTMRNIFLDESDQVSIKLVPYSSRLIPTLTYCNISDVDSYYASSRDNDDNIVEALSKYKVLNLGDNIVVDDYNLLVRSMEPGNHCTIFSTKSTTNEVIFDYSFPLEAPRDPLEVNYSSYSESENEMPSW